jgi:Domain of unknown function (DUF4390)
MRRARPLPRPLRVVLWACLAGWLAAVSAVRAQGVDLGSLELRRVEGALVLDFSARLTLSRAVEDALQRGVPMYFVAQAEVYRGRWYWRDERVSRVSRTWRLWYQPLTNTWRVSLGALAQSHASLSEAMAVISRVAGWRLAEPGQIDPELRYYVEFSYRLDNTQLPRPMQFGLGNDWTLGVERTLQVD